MKSILRHDEGDVSMEQQINEIVKNQQQHNLAISIMSASFGCCERRLPNELRKR